MRHVCDNCGADWHIDSLEEIKDYSMRVEPGGTVPSGECPDCGCLCYPEKKQESWKGEKAVSDTISLLGFYEGLVASLLDGNKKPDKGFLHALVKLNKKSTRDLKKLVS